MPPLFLSIFRTDVKPPNTKEMSSMTPWVIVALVFFLAPETPPDQMTYGKKTFQTEAECKDFIKSAEFAEDTSKLEAAKERMQIKNFQYVCRDMSANQRHKDD